MIFRQFGVIRVIRQISTYGKRQETIIFCILSIVKHVTKRRMWQKSHPKRVFRMTGVEAVPESISFPKTEEEILKYWKGTWLIPFVANPLILNINIFLIYWAKKRNWCISNIFEAIKGQAALYILWWSPFRYRKTTLWSFTGRYHQGYCNSLLASKRISCRTSIWLGHSWSPRRTRNWQRYEFTTLIINPHPIFRIRHQGTWRCRKNWYRWI